MAPPTGLVLVDKPAGITSHDAVARVRRLAGTRKVGHAGTLDPMATGLLVLGVGRATRLLGHLARHDKSYEATVRFGAGTVSDDADGDVVAQADASGLTEAQIRSAFTAQVGERDQVPSAVSAKKIDGRRAYDLVRAGEDVRLAPRRVHIAAIDVERIVPDGPFVDASIVVSCSTGTYVRAIARDAGAALGVGAHLTRLRRTRIGKIGVEQAYTLAQLAERFAVAPMAEVARAAFPGLDLDEQLAAAVRVGKRLPLADLPGVGSGTATAAAGMPAAAASGAMPDVAASSPASDAGPIALFAPAGELLALYTRHGDELRPLAVLVG